MNILLAEQVKTGLEETAKVAYGAVPQASVEVLVGNVIRTILVIVGLLFMVLIIYGGVTWMLGGREGKEKDVEKAHKIIEGAVIGLLIVAAGYAVTTFVVNNIVNATKLTP